MIAVRVLRKSERDENDVVSSGEVVVTSAHQTLDGRAPELPCDPVQAALETFGVPKRSKRALAEAERRAKKKYAERWHRSMGGRQHVSDVRGYSGEVKPAPAFNRPDVDAWRPTSVCSMTMDRALREMEFPSRLAGAEWVLE